MNTDVVLGIILGLAIGNIIGIISKIYLLIRAISGMNKLEKEIMEKVRKSQQQDK